MAQPFARTFGDNSIDGVAYGSTALRMTADGGFVVAGHTGSFASLNMDFWVLRFGADAAPSWQRGYGGIPDEYAASVQETADGGYIVAGMTDPFANRGDAWVVKLDSAGAIAWQRSLGGGGSDELFAVRQTSPDGGYILAGHSDSFGFAGEAWVVKLLPGGDVEWARTLGGARDEWAFAVTQTSDGGFVVAGRTESFGAGASDGWVFKLDGTGSLLWQHAFGGALEDWLVDVRETSDGGLVGTGFTSSGGSGLDDAWILRLDAAGTVVWKRTYGGANSDEGYSITETASDGGFAVTGLTYSEGAGVADGWVLRVDAAGLPLWQNTYGGPLSEIGHAIAEASDGSLLVAGTTASFGAGGDDFWLWRLDPDGTIGAACTLIAPATLASQDATAIQALDTTSVASTLPLASVATSETGYDTTAIVEEQCIGSGCVPPNTPPDEPSDEVSPHPLRILPLDAGVIVEGMPRATAYNLYADLVGSWYFPSAARGTSCTVTSWTTNADGTITLAYTIPGNSWIAVSSSNVCGESSAGRSSAGTERKSVGTWEACPLGP